MTDPRIHELIAQLGHEICDRIERESDAGFAALASVLDSPRREIVVANAYGITEHFATGGQIVSIIKRRTLRDARRDFPEK